MENYLKVLMKLKYDLGVGEKSFKLELDHFDIFDKENLISTSLLLKEILELNYIEVCEVNLSSQEVKLKGKFPELKDKEIDIYIKYEEVISLKGILFKLERA